MTETKKEATKPYVVVFDQIGVATGEVVGLPPVAVSEDYFRGDTVELTEADAKRHLASGAVIAKSDKRAKLVQANPPRSVGVTREIMEPVPLEEVEAAQAGDGGVTRTKGGKLGTATELRKLGVMKLKSLAAEHGVEVEPGDDKAKLASKLAKVTVPVDDGQTRNPGQGEDQSPPPEIQPDADS